jgi:hypothetical protein
MKRLCAALLILCAPVAAQASEAFTFVNTNTGAVDQVSLRPANPDGRASGASVYAIHTVTTLADGKKVESNGRCANWLLPPDNQFGQNGVCEFKDAAGPLYESRFTCAAPTKGATGIDCWGSLIGTGGPWKGRTGAFTLHTAQNATPGEGHWN